MKPDYTVPIPLKTQRELLLKTCRDIIFMMDLQLKVFLCSDAAVDAFKFKKRSEVLGMPVKDVLANKYDDSQVARLIQKCFEAAKQSEPLTHTEPNMDVVIVKTEKVLLLSIHPTQPSNQEDFKANFLMNMSHEIRTPMNAIKGMSNLLGLTKLNDIQSHYVSNIVIATESLLKLINNIMDISQINENKFEKAEEEYNLAELLSTVTAALSSKAAEKKLAFLVDVDPDTPALLTGDPARISQILLSLLDNAVKFSEKGYVKLSLDCKSVKDKEVRLKFSVEDTGIGIDKETEKDLFETFSKMHTDKSTLSEGAGLSLAISKKLAERLGGELYMKSKLMEGSVFTLEIPQKVKDKKKIAHVRDFGNKKVLLVPFGRTGELCAKMLNLLFVEYDICYNEEQFAEMLDKRTYTHVIYWESRFANIIAGHESKLASKRIVAVKEAGRAAFDISEKINVLFEPIIITDLANVLDMPMNDAGQTAPAIKPAQNLLGAFKLEDTEILVVDDNMVNLIVAEEMLKTYGAVINTASSGQEAVDAAAAKSYDLIFMDHMMPEMDGIEASRLIRAQGGENAKVPIIAFTANSYEGMRERFISNSMNDYITKPIDLSELNRVLKTWLAPKKLVFEKAEEVYPTTHNEELFAGLSKINGMEAYAALKEFDGNEKIYSAVLTTFATTLPSKIAKLDQSFASKDMERYRIEIHSLKSSLANIGHYELSEVAKRFEMSLRNNQTSYISKNHSKLMHDIKALDEQIEFVISANASPKGDDDAPCFDIRDNKDALNILKEGLDMLDTEAVDSIMKKLGSLRLDKNSANLFAKLNMHVSVYDYDGAVSVIDLILD